MAELYGRVVTAQVGPLRLEGFRVSFSVEKTNESNPNTAELQIFGLNPASRGEIQGSEKMPFVLEAGYTRTSAIIFSGEVVRPTNVKTPQGWVTKVTGADGQTPQKRVINTTLQPGVTVAEVIETLAGRLGVGAGAALRRARRGDFSGAIERFSSGLSLSGSVRSEMDRLTRSLGVDWSIQDGELQLLRDEDTIEGQATLLNRTSGLVGSPEQVEETKNKRKRVITKMTSLLQPSISPGRIVQLTSEAVSGSFKTLKVTHTGDTHGQPWYSQVEAVEIG
jgi:hypothetical protein